MIKLIEFQISNFCNRKCEWCPPFRDNDINKIEYIDEKILEIIKNYSNKKNINLNNCIFSIGRYGEPTHDCEFLTKFAKKIKKMFPDNYLTINTNGDYLFDMIKSDCISVFDRIIISRYINENFNSALSTIVKTFDYSKIKNLKYDIKNQFIKFIYGKTLIKYRYAYHLNMKLYNRGSLLNVPKNYFIDKKNKCDMAGKAIMIDYNGLVYPCCELSSMNNKHYLLNCGNILYDDINIILKKINSFKGKKYLVCTNCNIDGNKQLE